VHSHYEDYWKRLPTSKRLRNAIIVSIIVHILVIIVFSQTYMLKRTPAAGNIYQVQLISEQMATQPPQEAVTPPQPEPPPTPPPPEPKPEPPKPEPKPEPPKEEVKPKPEPPKPKPEPPKEEVKPKLEPKPKEEPKPKQPAKAKTEPIREPIQDVKPTPAPTVPLKTGITMESAGLPTELDAWSRLVQRLVDRAWVQPTGSPLGSQVEVSVWVSRDGNLLADPVIVKDTADPRVGESAIKALKDAAPFPPFPDGFRELEQLVVFTFTIGS